MASDMKSGVPTGRRALRKVATKRLTVCAVLTALGVCISWLGSLVGVLDLCTPLLTALLLVPIVIEYGKGYPFGVWLATVILALLLLPNKSPAAVYLVFGYYPILKAYLERLRPLPCRLLKQLIFAAVDLALVYGSNLVVGVQEDVPTWYNAALLVGGYLVLNLVDIALTRLISAYVFKYRPRFAKWMR